MKDASELILATDPDREGESISWHLKELLKPKVKVRRIVFHEITEEAVNAALAEAHDVDENLVRAQESRRILDRLYGYTLSPVLWKKVQTGLSAGRVQSVAVRLIVEREEERLAFRTGQLLGSRSEAARRHDRVRRDARQGRRPAHRDRQGLRQQGHSSNRAPCRLLGEKDAQSLREALMRRLPWTVTSVEEKPFTQRPSPPFTTSTLQQEANRKLGFSSERTMQIAQRLFQGMDLGGGDLEGLISYHRTDSTTLSQKALGEAALAGQGAVRRRLSTRASASTRPRSATRRKRTKRFARRDFHRTPQSLERILESDELQDLRADLEARDRVADGRRASCCAPRSRSPARPNDGDAVRRSRRAARRSSSPATCAPTSKAPTIRTAELDEQDTMLPKLAVGDQVLVARQARPGTDPARRSMPRGTRRRRRRATPKHRSSSGSKRKASAGRRPMRRRSPPFSAAATSRDRARRSCRASPRSR